MDVVTFAGHSQPISGRIQHLSAISVAVPSYVANISDSVLGGGSFVPGLAKGEDAISPCSLLN